MAKPINVVIKGDYTDRDINRAIRDLNTLKTTGAGTQTAMGNLASSMKNILGPAMVGAGIAAGAMALKFGVDSVQAFIADEKAAASLARTLKNLGLEGATAAVERFVDAQQRATGVSDEQLRPAMDRLLRSTKNVQESQDLLSLALDVSAGSGKSLEQVVQALSRAHDGNFGALGRLGTGIDAATLKSKDFDRVVANLSKTFDGQASVAAETLAGDLQQLGVAFDELKEAFGRGFIDGLANAAGGMDELSARIQAFEPVAGRIGEFIGITAIKGLETFTAAFNQMAEAIQAVKDGDFAGAIRILGSETANFAEGLRVGGGDFELLPRQMADAARYSGLAAQYLRDANDEVEKVGTSTRRAASGTRELSKAQQEAQLAAQAFAEQVGTLEVSLQSLITEVQGATAASGKATFEAIGKQIDAFKAQFAEAKQFAQGIVSSFMGQLDLGAAIDQAKAAGTSIVEEFAKQGEKAAAFGAKMQEVLALKLSRAAMKDILALGFDRGMDVMNELTTGAVEANIANINKVYDSVELMANQVADQAKSIFYDAGLMLMITTLEAMIMELLPAGKTRKKLLAMMDVLAESMNRTATITIGVVGPSSTPEFNAAMANYTGPVFSPSNPLDLSAIGEGVVIGGPGFAEGGIATRPTPGIFGEAGPEALIPLDRMGDFGGGNTYQITVQTGVGDPRQIGEQVVSYIKRFEAASGPVFARA
jgi:hypothetical protein